MGSSFRFCTLVFTVLLCGCPRAVVPPPPPPPPHDHPNSVTLQVQGGTSGYICTFTGGDDHNGNIEVKHSEGDVNIHVDLSVSADPKFTILAPYFDTDPKEQLHGKQTDAGRKALIHDRNTDPLDAYYGLIMQDSSTSPASKFICDPRIVNN